MERAVYFCEEVSNIEFKGGLVLLTDRSGDTEITRAMALSTFSRCVHGAYALLQQIERDMGANVVDMDGCEH